MEQGYLATLSDIGIKKSDSQKVDYLRNRVLAYVSMKNLVFSRNEIYNFCSHIGYDVNSLGKFVQQRVENYPNGQAISKVYNCNAIIEIFNSFIDIDEFIVAVCFFANANTPNTNRQDINDIIIDAVNQCNVDLCVHQKDDNLYVYRRGAEVLDNPLIFELLSWLPAYKPALKSFETALQQYANKEFERNCVDNLRHALEMLLKEKLGSGKSLENLKAEIGQFFKANGVPAHISNMYITLQTYYTDYQNNYVKHDDKVDQREIEFILYLTGAFMRFVISVDKNILPP